MQRTLLPDLVLSAVLLAACTRTGVTVGESEPDTGLPGDNGIDAPGVSTGGAMDGAQSVLGTGGTPAVGAGGALGVGGAPGTGGGLATSDASTSGADGSPTLPNSLPCDILRQAGSTCVSAHSTVRVIVSDYTGPLYQLCDQAGVAGPSACKGHPLDVGSKDGYADVAAHEAFCSAGSCTITKIYDQSGRGNDLEPAPKGGNTSKPASAAQGSALKVAIHGQSAYGILIQPGVGYRAGCNGCTLTQGKGMATDDEPQTLYWVTSQKDLVDGCCFDYGNAEVTCHDDGNGSAEALNFGAGVVWGTGYGGKPGPWIMADLENGLFAGWERGQEKSISTNIPLKHDFVTGVLLGDTADKNGGKGRFALLGGDATAGTLQVMYDGIRPERPGYVPMTKQGSTILGIAGDGSNTGGGRFYEGAIATGPVATMQTIDALQTAIVAAGYGR
jgi:hypothetical protein